MKLNVIIITAIVGVVILIITLTSMGASEATMYYVRTLCLAIGGLAALIIFLFGLSKKEDSEQGATSKSGTGKEGFGFKTESSPKDKQKPTTFKLDLHDIYPPVLGIDLGTTTSLVATIYKNEVYIIKNKHGDDTITVK